MALTAAQPAEQIDDLPASQARPQRHIARNIGEPPVQVDRVAPRIDAEQADFAAILTQQAEQDADGGGLPRAVGLLWLDGWAPRRPRVRAERCCR